jgi:hypothetical protein
MSKKKKKPRRKKLRYPSPENLAARLSGVAINENRRGTLVRLMDTAIREWFFERDPFPIHLLVCASYMVLADLGGKNGKGPIIEKDFGRFSMTTVYDFLRHAEPDMLNDSVDLVPTVNEWMLFDAITSFGSLFNGSTVFMRTFDAYYVLHPRLGGGAHPKLHKHAADFLPKGITVEEAARLGRVEFFMKVTEMFAAEIQAEGVLPPRR